MSEQVPPVQLNKAQIKYLEKLPPIELKDIPIEDARRFFALEKDTDISGLPITVEKMLVPSSNNVDINIEVYRPKSASDEAILPVLIYLPGGGWSLARQGLHPFFVSKLAIEAKCTVVFVNYLLSPEVKFPYALEECFTVLKWLNDPLNAKVLSIDSDRLAISGDSAGGNLAAALAKTWNI
ncbi:Alpha/Beta hydrolase protein [Sporodiniella umbellata]|nr:Alpha/Beta hydrolase protein [Sporodiniella umbellata]